MATLAAGQAELSARQKDLMAHLTETMERLSQQISGKLLAEMGENSDNRFKGQREHHSSPRTGGSLNNFVPRTIKLDFPKYEGRDDPTPWVCKAEKYFTLHDIAESDKVTLASFYLDGDAGLWFQMLEQELIYVTWEDFKNGIQSRFGSNQF